MWLTTIFLLPSQSTITTQIQSLYPKLCSAPYRSGTSHSVCACNAIVDMNNGTANPPAQGQPPNGQPQPQRQHIFRPEHIRNLPDYFSNEDKTKWEGALRSLWGQMNTNPPDSTSHMEAKKMLFDFSRNLTSKLALFRAQQASAMHAQRPQPLSQAPQPIPQQMPQAMQSMPHTQAENNQNMHKPMAPIPQQQTAPKYPAKIVEHVESFPYSFPPQYTPDSQEAQQWLKTVKQRYMSGLGTMENAKNRVQQLKALEKKRTDEGKPLTPEETKEFAEKINQAQKAHAEASSWIEKFRASQATQKQNASGQPGDNASQNQQAPTRPQINPQQNNPSLQSTQTVNAAIEAARNQQMGGGRPHLGNAAIGAPGGQNQPTKHEDGTPAPINTAIQQMQRVGQTNNSPQTGQQQTPVQSAGPPQEPKPLSHQAALQTAARTYSSGQTSGTPNVMGHSHPQAPVMPRDASMSLNPKMPIAKRTSLSCFTKVWGVPALFLIPVIELQANYTKTHRTS